MSATLENVTLLDRLDNLIASKHLLSHPFYHAWTAGELSLDALRDYAGQYYQHVKAFPTYLSAVHMHCDDLEVRRNLVENLNDEEGKHPTHPELWLHFAEGLGMTAAEADSTQPNAHTRATIDGFRSICGKRSVAEGLAALYAYESQIPAVSQSKIDGLKQFYGFTNEQAWAYFTEHIVADVEHAAVEREMLESVATEAEEEAILAAANDALDAINGLLTGVAEMHGIEC
jgi:pyrroloquinoline-quinone synthase